MLLVLKLYRKIYRCSFPFFVQKHKDKKNKNVRHVTFCFIKQHCHFFYAPYNQNSGFNQTQSIKKIFRVFEFHYICTISEAICLALVYING